MAEQEQEETAPSATASSGGGGAGGGAGATEQDLPPEVLDNDNNEWVCGVCQSFAGGEVDHLVLCDGPCLRSFHLRCVGLSVEELNDLEVCVVIHPH